MLGATHCKPGWVCSELVDKAYKLHGRAPGAPRVPPGSALLARDMVLFAEVNSAKSKFQFLCGGVEGMRMIGLLLLSTD